MDTSFENSPFINRNALGSAAILFVVMLLAGAVLHYVKGGLYWGGYTAVSFFYSIMFYLGLSVARGHVHPNHRLAEMLMAGRSLPLGMAIMTMTATWVGGGFVNGTVESVATDGLVWAQAPWGYALSLIVGGLIFARPMRRLKYTTMLDPLEDRFGRHMAGLLYIPALTGEVFWTASILTALGTTFGFILDIDFNTSIVISAIVAIIYTSVGGLRSVAITDVFQLIILIGGLYLITAFVWPSEGLSSMYASYQAKMGDAASLVPPSSWGNARFQWWDSALLLIFGGIPWHVYFQRVLSSRDESTAQWLSIVAGFMCLLAALPAVLIGMLCVTTDWQAMGAPAMENGTVALPYAIRYLTPPLVALIALGALAAGVMSSVDSSILSASSMGTWNVIRPLFGLKNDDPRLLGVLRKLIWIIGVSATLMALKIQSVYQLWFLCSDFVYCILFAQLLTALFDKKANLIGSAAGYAVSAILRFGAGESVLGIPAFLPYPMLDGTGATQFPFRTVSMLAGLVTIIVVSRIFQSISPARPLIGRSA
jgi:high affinity choline transporter 7